ncbi:hypothetical protein K0I73_16125 [Shewanella mesophila]|uniref:hypothetical protein n=1 Tax=Shewanella mesophila TaxID=2864208 RepID=UPI001C65C7A4|nr:hypothetical protein [Shewanella mesophila]QYJ85689.1 hypothetical protein K0I73_16125 [Shewanella mesophila]
MKIKIRRSSSHSYGIFRKMKVVLDGKVIGHLKRGTELEFEYSEGSEIFVKIDWCRSPKLKLSVENTSLLCGTENFFKALLFTFIWPVNVFKLECG